MVVRKWLSLAFALLLFTSSLHASEQKSRLPLAVKWTASVGISTTVGRYALSATKARFERERQRKQEMWEALNGESTVKMPQDRDIVLARKIQEQCVRCEWWDEPFQKQWADVDWVRDFIILGGIA